MQQLVSAHWQNPYMTAVGRRPDASTQPGVAWKRWTWVPFGVSPELRRRPPQDLACATARLRMLPDMDVKRSHREIPADVSAERPTERLRPS